MAILAWAPLAIMLVIYAPFVRLSAKILKVADLGWKNSFQFSILFAVLILATRATVIYGNLDIPVFISVPLGIGLLLACGTLFLARSVKTKEGITIGTATGFKITALTMGLLTATGVMIFIVLGVISM